MWSRRALIGAAAPLLAVGKPEYKVGITNNTRGGWEKDFWLATRESHEVGYRHVETFFSFLQEFADKPEEVKRRLAQIGVGIITVSNSGPMEVSFHDRSKQAKVIEDHVKLAKFIRALGGNHMKINLGPRRATGTTAEDLKVMAGTVDKLGKKTAAEGIRLAIHAHMWNQFENRSEIDYMMSHTDAADVAFVLDTGHITLAGMDPVALAFKLGNRVIEYHLKDTKPEFYGGAKKRMDRPDMMVDPVFLPLGAGGVDFDGLKKHLDRLDWKGWLTVELDTSPMRPPKESAAISLRYLRDTWKVNA